MRYLKIQNRNPVAIQKAYFSVGSGAGYDLNLPGSGEKIFFSIHLDQERCTLIPGGEKVRINGRAVSQPTALEISDRIECKDFVALLIDDCLSAKPAVTDENPKKAFEILEHLAIDLGQESSLGAAIHRALGSIVELAGAETGYFLSEIESHSEWNLLASVSDVRKPLSNEARRRELISSTILSEAIRERRPIYVESMVGHPWEKQASIVEAMIFSFACLPLFVGERIFGAVYLFTRTPGFSIRQEGLEDLKTVATQVALILASQNELRRARKSSRPQPVEFDLDPKSACASLIYDRSNSENPMKTLEQRVVKLAPSELNILIRGESGTGKELIAKEIHLNSNRAAGPFVAINCAAIPPSLMESTLFGYAKGAFTGAHKDRSGKFVQAQGGTIFLDEIGDLPADLQVKLLRVLQEKEVEAVGADKPVPVDFRVVAATHQDLEAAVREGTFRQDLYYRLNGASLNVPALKDRGDDVALLAQYFLSKHDPELFLTEAAAQRLAQHQWPGNVRELEQVVGRAAALADEKGIQPEDLELGVQMVGTGSGHQDLIGYDDFSSLKEVQIAFTRDFIKRVLTKYNGNRSKGAAHLGISERTLYRFLSTESSDKSGSLL